MEYVLFREFIKLVLYQKKDTSYCYYLFVVYVSFRMVLRMKRNTLCIMTFGGKPLALLTFIGFSSKNISQ